MNKWQQFTASQQLLPAQTGNTLCALSDTGILYVGGEDAQEFLQNQLSNDISHIDANKAQLSSFSNAKGRMIAIFRVIQIDGGYLLIMPKSILQQVMQQLQKYVIRAQVVMADITESFAMTGISSSPDLLPVDERFPTQLNEVYQSDSLISVHVNSSDGQQRYLLLSNDEEEAIELVSTLSEKLTLSVADSWRLQEIQAGVPTLYPQTMLAFVLQMSNLQLLDGVSFKKGCYPGQEVVARMQYLGKLKRRMYLARIASDHCPMPGDELKSRDAEGKDGAGKVVDAICENDNSCLMLFIAQIEKAEADNLVLLDQPDSAIKLQTLPYDETSNN
jgi:tRNA-modifying protein YgfZ